MIASTTLLKAEYIIMSDAAIKAPCDLSNFWLIAGATNGCDKCEHAYFC